MTKLNEMTTNFITSEEIPLVIEPSNKRMKLNELLNLLRDHHEFFKQNLLKYGALLLRNFPISNEDDFTALISGLNTGKFVNYIGGDSPRNKIRDGIYTSTEAPPSIKIPLHNELSFVNNYPKYIYFYCQIPPQERGETIISNARKVYNSIDEDVKRRFIEKGLKYVSCYYYKSRIMNLLNKLQKSHKSWIDVFETSNKHEVEKKCFENDFHFQWNQKDWIKISQIRPAVISHPITHEKVWFNQAHLYDFNPRLLGYWRYLGSKIFYYQKHTRLHEVFFADQTKIPRTDIYHILDVLDANTVYFPWQKGDVLVLDNILAMHGRAVFTGKRRVLTAMTG